jgi:hypothetical protein
MPKFTHKHYEEIAKIIGNSNISDADVTLLTGFFKSDNNKFDANRFLNAIAKQRDSNFYSSLEGSVTRDQL